MSTPQKSDNPGIHIYATSTSTEKHEQNDEWQNAPIWHARGWQDPHAYFYIIPSFINKK